MSFFISKPTRIEFNYKNKRFSISAKECSIFRKGIGLMFRTKDTDNLIFSFDKKNNPDFTALFCFFKFLIIWLDENNSVVDMRIAKPFELVLSSEKSFKKVIELPLNRKNLSFIKYLVGKANI